MNRSARKRIKEPESKPELGDGSDNRTKLGLERLIFFSDAVFAIAITLLALEIRLPAGEKTYSDAELLSLLGGMWQHYLAYIISFMVIGIFWMSHHRKFQFIVKYDRILGLLNLLFLMIIAFIPFPSSVLSEYSGRYATIFYAFTMVLVSLAMTVLWWYASRHNRLIDPHMSVKQKRRQFLSPLITAAIFLLSIGIAFISPDLAKLSWWLILISSMLLTRDN
jgi:TMEM175 potassium channel family protein